MDLDPQSSEYSLICKLDCLQPNIYYDEEEAAEEEKKRNEEVNLLLQDVADEFDDLIEDGASSANTTQYQEDHGDVDASVFVQNKPLLVNGNNAQQGFSPRKYASDHSDISPNTLYLNQNLGGNTDGFNNMDYQHRQNFLNMAFINQGDTGASSDFTYVNGDDTGTPSTHQSHCVRSKSQDADSFARSNSTDDNELYRNTGFNDMSQLKLLLDIRTRETKRLTEELQDAKKVAEDEKTEMFKKLMMSEAEKERAEKLHREAEGRLFSSRERIEDLEKQIASQKVNIENLEKTKSKLKEDLEICRATVTELQKTNLALERETLSSTEKHNAICLARQKKYEDEIKLLQQELEATVSKVRLKDSDCDRLEKTIMELTRERDKILVEKGEVINQLTHALEECQRQCQKLVTSSMGQKMARQLTTASQEKEELQHKYNSLMSELETMKSELHHYKNLSELKMLSAQVAESRGLNFNRGDNEDEDNHKFTQNLMRKDKIIKTLKENEKKYLAQIEKLKEAISKMQSQLTEQDEMSSELEKQKKDADNALQQLKKCQDDLTVLKMNYSAMKREKDEVVSTCEQLKNELAMEKSRAAEKASNILSLCHEEKLKVREECEQEYEEKISDLNAQLTETLRELDDVKAQYVDISSTKEKIIIQLEKEQASVKSLAVQLKTEREALSKTLEKELLDKESLQSELEAEKMKSELQRRRIEEFEKHKSEIAKKIEEEVERAKVDAISEWKQREDYYNEKIQELENKCSLLQQKLAQEMEQNANQVVQLSKHIRLLESSANSHQSSNRPNSESVKDVAVSPIKSFNVSLEEIKRETSSVYIQKLKEMEKCYQLELLKNQRNLFCKLKEMEYKYQKVQEECEVKSEEIEMIKRMLSETVADAEEQDNKWQEKVSSLLKEIEGLKASLQKLNKEKEKLNKSTEDIESVENRLQTKEKELENMRSEMSVVIMKWKKEIDAVRKTNEELDTKYKDCVAKYNNAKSVISKCKTFINDREKEWNSKYKSLEEKCRENILSVQSKMQDTVKRKGEEMILKMTTLENENTKLRELVKRTVQK